MTCYHLFPNREIWESQWVDPDLVYPARAREVANELNDVNRQPERPSRLPTDSPPTTLAQVQGRQR